MKKVISLFIVFAIILSYCFIPQSVNASFLDTIDPPRYWEDPQQITDEHFFGVYDKESETWKDPGLLCYSNPLLAGVQSLIIDGRYNDAKEELRSALSKKFATFPKKTAFNTDEKSTYLTYLLYKHNIISVNTPIDVIEVKDEWGWVEVDITSKINASTKETGFFLVSLEKDDSVIEISSRRGEAQYAPRIEAVVNSQVVSSVANMDAMTSAGRNTYITSDNLTKDNPGILKVSESSSSIGNGSNPVDENTFRTYFRFNLEDIIKPGDSISKVTLKLYTRVNGSKDRKQMLLYSLGSYVWDGSLKWSDSKIQNSVFVYDGDDAINWNTSDINMPSTVIEDPTNMDGMYNLISRTILYDEPDALYYFLCRLMSYMYDVGIPPAMKDLGSSMSLRTAGRVTTLSSNLRYIIDLEELPTDILIAILKHIWLMMDWFENPENFNFDSNHGIYQTRGLMYGAVNFDDIFERGSYWLELSLNRFTEMSSNYQYSDGTGYDAATSYVRDMVDLLCAPFEVVQSVGKSTESIDFPEEYGENIQRLAKYLMDTTYNFYDPQFGDTVPYTNRAKVDELLQYFPDDNILWVETNGKQGIEPDYTSILYPVGGKITMRSDWTDKGLFLFTNNDRFHHAHAHDDDLSITVFAYGQYLLADPLYYTYTWGNDKAWLTGKTGHNLVVINKNQGFTGQQNSDYLGYDNIGPIERWETNDGFDFVSMVEEKVGKNADEVAEDVYHTRDIMFIKDKFWIVTDLLEPQDKDEYNRYEQRWHFLPEAKIQIDPETMVLETTAFRANMKIYPVDPYDYEPVENYNEDATGIQQGLYSPGKNQLVTADYAYYLKSDVKGDTSFATVLFPMKDSSEYDVKTAVLPSNLKSTEATAISVEYEKEGTNTQYNGTYFNLHKESLRGENLAGDYSTDARLLYTETSDDKYTVIDLANGTHVKDIENNVELIYSSDSIDGITVKWDAKGIYIDSMNEIDLTKLTIYTNEEKISNVYYKDFPVSYKQNGRYIYFGDSPIINDTPSVPEDNLDTETPSKPNSPSETPGTQSKPQGTQSGNNHGSSGGGGGSFTPVITPEVPKPEEREFSDVTSDRWSAEYIKELSSLGVISGYEDGTFRPENNITREEFVKLVFEAFKIPLNDSVNVFADVSNDAWYQKYVSSAYRLGIVNGITENAFGVGKNISRQDMAVIIIRALEYKNQSLKQGDVSADFVDSKGISSYAFSAVETLANAGIISGNEVGEFMPSGNATREQVAKIICLVLKNI